MGRILNKKDQERLAASRKRAVRATQPKYLNYRVKRRFYQLRDYYDQRLSAWEFVDLALFRLAGHIERRGSMAGDERRWKEALEFIEDIRTAERKR